MVDADCVTAANLVVHKVRFKHGGALPENWEVAGQENTLL